jgi:hypothetical protein
VIAGVLLGLVERLSGSLLKFRCRYQSRPPQLDMSNAARARKDSNAAPNRVGLSGCPAMVSPFMDGMLRHPAAFVLSLRGGTATRGD